MAAPPPLALAGIDFRRASARHRERVRLRDGERAELCERLREAGVADGLACLDTCNRVEWIVSTGQPEWAAEVLKSQMIVRSGGTGPALSPYVRVGEAAAQHLLEVAAGLQSFVLGEREIASQLQRALARSRREETGSSILNGLGSVAGRLARDAHRTTISPDGPRGIHDLAVGRVRQSLPARETRILVVGTGQIGEKVTRALRRRGYAPTLCNRSSGAGWTRGHRVHGLPELSSLLANSDAVFLCTGAESPVVSHRDLGDRREPLLILDLGVPAQAERAVEECRAVELWDIEGLQGWAGRPAGAAVAELAGVRQRVERAVEEFNSFCAERPLGMLLRRTQERHQHYVREQIPRLLDRVVPDLDPELRARLEWALKGQLRRYTNGVFTDIHELVADLTH